MVCRNLYEFLRFCENVEHFEHFEIFENFEILGIFGRKCLEITKFLVRMLGILVEHVALTFLLKMLGLANFLIENVNGISLE